MSGGDEVTSRDERKPDVLFVHSPNESGDGFRVIRAREDSVQVGEIKAVKEGEPIKGDLVRLTHRKESSRLFDVEVVLSQQDTAAAARRAAGPPQVATESYMRNWETIFGAREKKQDALPN
jgi:hypothetical protein